MISDEVRGRGIGDVLRDAQEPPPVLVGSANGGRETRELTKLRASVISGDAVKSIPRPEPLLDGVLDLDSLAVLYGPPGAGKSFLALDWSLSVATGAWWQGHAVTQRPVVYVVGEGLSGLGSRVLAWQAHNRLYEVGAMHWLTHAVNLLDRRWADALARLCAELEAGLVVIDTLARCMPGADENSPKDMSTAVDSLDRIRDATGACVKAVHHSGKDLTAGSRGHSSLKGAADTELRLEGAEGRLTLRAEKQKHHPDGHVIARLALVETGDSCAIGPLTAESFATDDRLTENDQAALAALRAIELPGGVSATVWHESADVARSTFYRCVSKLLARALIVNVGTERAPRYLASPSPDLSPTESQ